MPRLCRPPALCESKDVEELDVEPVRGQPGDLGDSVTLLEAQEQLLPRVVRSLELLEPEAERRGLRSLGEEQAGLDVVGAAELVALAKLELRLAPSHGPVLERCRENGQILVGLDLDPVVVTFRGRLARRHLQGRRPRAFPVGAARKT